MDGKNIKSLISEFFKVDIGVINNDLMAGDIPQWDSLGHIGLISHLEKELDISIDVDQSLEMETVEDIIEIISEIVGK
jgi:acyl carrier protein